jgi:hypothetical protein
MYHVLCMCIYHTYMHTTRTLRVYTLVTHLCTLTLVRWLAGVVNMAGEIREWMLRAELGGRDEALLQRTDDIANEFRNPELDEMDPVLVPTGGCACLLPTCRDQTTLPDAHAALHTYMLSSVHSLVYVARVGVLLMHCTACRISMMSSTTAMIDTKNTATAGVSTALRLRASVQHCVCVLPLLVIRLMVKHVTSDEHMIT